MPDLVVIVGPIASGKSTVAGALGSRLRDAGRTVAVVDLDEVVETSGGWIDLTHERFRTAQLVTGRLVAAWLDLGVDVIAHGPFFQPEEEAALVHALPAAVVPRRVYLHATYEVAARRVTADADRGGSKDLDFLHSTYERVERLRPGMPASEWTFDTTTMPWSAIVDELADALLR